MIRDPRKNPKAGDITVNVDGTVYTVISVEGDCVRFKETHAGDNVSVEDTCHLSIWVENSTNFDSVVHAEGELTGWLRYWICGEDGARGKWIYLHVPSCTDKESAKQFILHQHEAWATTTENYSMEVEIDVVPPVTEVQIVIDRYETLSQNYANMASGLKATIGL